MHFRKNIFTKKLILSHLLNQPSVKFNSNSFKALFNIFYAWLFITGFRFSTGFRAIQVEHINQIPYTLIFG